MESSKKPPYRGNDREVNIAVRPKEGELLLPHERDQAPDPEKHDGSETTGPREVIRQAARDIRRGLRNTDLRGIPTNVPGPGVAPEDTPGADVPMEGPTSNKAQPQR